MVRTLDFLRFADETRTETTAASDAPKDSSNQSAASLKASRGGRVIVLLFDDLSFRPQDGIGLRVSAERLLPSFGPEDLVGVATTSGLGPVLSPTRDREALKAMMHNVGLMGRADPQTSWFISIPEATEWVRGSRKQAPFAGRECAILGRDGNALQLEECIDDMKSNAQMVYSEAAERASTQLAAYVACINALRPAPAPRILIAFSGGVPLNVARIPGEIDPISRAATTADVQLFTLTPYEEGTDLTTRGSAQKVLPPNDRRSVRRAENEYLIDGAKSVSEAAGGEGFTVIGTADRFISRVLTETSAIYRLGVEVPSSTKESDYLKVKVAVHRDGVTVRVKPLAQLPQPDAPALSPADALKQRVAQGGVEFGVKLTVGAVVHRDRDPQQVQLAIEASVSATAKAPIRAMYALVDKSGHIARSGEATLSHSASDDD